MQSKELDALSKQIRNTNLSLQVWTLATFDSSESFTNLFILWLISIRQVSYQIIFWDNYNCND